eukprot:TRINITY_DN28432_c0_g1_i2.p1 TRINITY_DN28432_c0_g1~~TRINITY_DN28432_c0_g1_i2.p1  ORF type:complete len:261 (-),score=50.23 TRINITY_DN28432_c0_g1_i2:100-816(-)
MAGPTMTWSAPVEDEAAALKPFAALPRKLAAAPSTPTSIWSASTEAPRSVSEEQSLAPSTCTDGDRSPSSSSSRRRLRRRRLVLVGSDDEEPSRQLHSPVSLVSAQENVAVDDMEAFDSFGPFGYAWGPCVREPSPPTPPTAPTAASVAAAAAGVPGRKRTVAMSYADDLARAADLSDDSSETSDASDTCTAESDCEELSPATLTGRKRSVAFSYASGLAFIRDMTAASKRRRRLILV